MRLVSGLLLATVLVVAFCRPAEGAAPTLPQPASPPIVGRVTPIASEDAKALIYQAMDLSDAGRLDESNAALDRATELTNALGKRGRNALPIIAALKARNLMRAGQFDAAETAFKQLIVEAESASGKRGNPSPLPFSSLAELYMMQGRFAEAEPLLQRSLAITERDAGKNDPATAEALNSLAVLYLKTGQTEKGLPILERILKIFQRGKSAYDRQSTADALVNLGNAYQFSGNYEKALDYFRQAYELDTKYFGPDHPNTNLALSNAGVLLGLMQRYDEAAPALETVLKQTTDRYGADNPQTAHAANNIGWVELGRNDNAKALTYLRAALATYLAHRELQKAGPNARGAAVDEREVARTILGFLNAASRLAPTDPAASAALMDEAFQAAQQVHRGKAAEALALTTARFAVGNSALAALIRERQDLAGQHRALEAALTAAFSQPAERRDLAKEAAGREQFAAMAARITQISAEIEKGFPDYARLADPKPLTVAEAQGLLGPDEALVLLAPFGGGNGEANFTFVITREGARWRAGSIGQTKLTGAVQALRCGLDVGQWATKDGRAGCLQLVGAEPDGKDLPFDADLAYHLYDELFGELAPMLAGKTLLVVAPDPLASLPFQVLVTAPQPTKFPKGEAFAKVAFLARSNAVAVLPSAAALRAAHAAAGSRAPNPYIGFGDPALVGGLDCAEPQVASACPSIGAPAAANATLVAAGAARIDSVFRGGGELADVEAVRALCPLPETALELACVAKSVDGPADSVHTGEQATVPAVLAAHLGDYRIVHFATHGLLAGEMASQDGTISEPALVMTPPSAPTAQDDGLLRASLIASMKLDADWVVLSACNTAAGLSLGGEAMSGLASAFLYAGARALLVSHWPVRTDAAVLITTSAFSHMKADPTLGRAEAIRRAMVELIDAPSGAYAHPAVWAPFAVVGESGPARL
ncbi:CHAT domain-containing protein/tetratricopeptide (TPR) repeat protein [Kaistia hirudinis]|uniref:CHAT domain-containing protein/tetratricopeptide (TPR) repeat protein n=1 Tax=Kaistia hirudinis TaxID=1293440 RepID=A0A840AKS8_9HYPH|nr:CHAT domain-containing tetratricopeptide repeat protein [Kaistia hirudinis]MBB3929531.1 CHAT domain-containing protein/tetratricopeptide (TPR) repeat protein [Kaistia hirudinis]